MPEYHLISERSAVGNVESVVDEITVITENGVPDSPAFKKSKRLTFPSELHQIYYVPQLVCLGQGWDRAWYEQYFCTQRGGRKWSRILPFVLGQKPMIISLTWDDHITLACIIFANTCPFRCRWQSCSTDLHWNVIYIDWFIKGIFPRERNIIPSHSDPVSVLLTCSPPLDWFPPFYRRKYDAVVAPVS